MNTRLDKNEKIMMLSNVFLVLPVIFACVYGEWLYCFFASGLFVFSPLYHWYKIKNPKSVYFKSFKVLDWLFAFGAFFYMYYYVYHFTDGQSENILYFALSLVILFFLYGWQHGDYKKWHPWFHIIAPIVSSVILIVARP